MFIHHLFFSSFFLLQGITIKPLVKFLNVKRANKKKPTMNERIHERVSSTTTHLVVDEFRLVQHIFLSHFFYLFIYFCFASLK